MYTLCGVHHRNGIGCGLVSPKHSEVRSTILIKEYTGTAHRKTSFFHREFAFMSSSNIDEKKVIGSLLSHTFFRFLIVFFLNLTSIQQLNPVVVLKTIIGIPNCMLCGTSNPVHKCAGCDNDGYTISLLSTLYSGINPSFVRL